MLISGFFKSNKPRQFNFTPRYYNARKEALQQRVKDAKREMGIEDEDSPYQRGVQRGMFTEHIERRRTQQRKSSLRLVLITVILCILAYYLLYQ